FRGGVSRTRNAAGDSHRQRRTVCVAGGGRVVAASGGMDEAGDHAGADRSRTSGAERAARAYAPDHERRNRFASASQPARAAAPDGRVPAGIQPGASARSVSHANPERLLCPVAARLSGADSRTGIRWRLAGAQSSGVRGIYLETRERVSEQDAERRTHRSAPHRRPLLPRVLRGLSSGPLRQLEAADRPAARPSKGTVSGWKSGNLKTGDSQIPTPPAA